MTGTFTVASGGILKLNGARVEGNITLADRTQIETDNVEFTSSSSITVSLGDYAGNTEETLAWLKEAEFECSNLYVTLNPVGDCTLADLGLANIRYTLYSNVLVGTSVVVKNGVTLNSNGKTIYGTLECCEGSVLTGSITVASGGTLKLNGARILGSIMLETGAAWEGSDVVFTSTSTLQISEVTGNASERVEELLSQLERVTFEDNVLTINVSSSGDVSFSSLDGVELRYYLRSNVASGCTATVHGGTSLDGFRKIIYGTLNCLSGSVLKGEHVINSGGKLQLNGCRVEGCVRFADGALFEGSGVTFAESGSISFKGVVGDASARVAEFLAQVGTVVCESGWLTVGAEYASDISFSTLEGVNIRYRLDSSVWGGRTVTLKQGATLDGGGLGVVGVLNCEADTVLTGVLDLRSGGIVRMLEGGTLDGLELNMLADSTLYLNGVSLKDASISCNGTLLDMQKCCGSGVLTLTSGGHNIRENDFSGITVNVKGLQGQVDLSGNYWGTTNMEEIKSMIVGYDESRVIISDVLGFSPMDDPSLPPVLTLGAPGMKKVQDGLAAVTFSWSCSKEASYEITIDGTSHITSDTRFTINLSDGTHNYSVKAVDAAGNEVTVQGDELTLDYTPPVLTLDAPQMTRKGNGSTEVTFSWSCGESVTCILRVNGSSYSVSGTQHTVLLGDGTHSYSITARDAAGNSITQQGGIFTLNSAAPELTLATPQVKKLRNGTSRVSFSWSSNKAASYELTVNGKSYKVKGTSQTVDLADGTYSYSIKATDEYGNVSTTPGAAFMCDATAPKLSLPTSGLAVTSKETGRTTLNWSLANAEDEPVTYTVYEKAGKKGAMLGSVTLSGTDNLSLTLNKALGQNTYTYYLVARDASGNESQTSVRFTVDTVAPALALTRSSVTKGNPARKTLSSASLSWKATDKSKVSYTVSMYAEDGSVLADYNELALTRTSLTIKNLKDGKYRYEIIGTDAAANVSTPLTGSIVVDTIPVDLSGVSLPAADRGFTNSQTPTISWQGEAGVTYTLQVGREKKTYTGEGEHRYTITGANGNYSYTLTAVDEGNNKTTKRGSFTVDTIAPALALTRSSVTKGNPARKTLSSASLSWKVTDKSKVSYTVSVYAEDGSVLADYNKLALTKTSLTVKNLVDGNYRYEIIGTDAAGNASTPLTGSFVVDTIAPVLNVQAPTGTTNSAQPTISWWGEEGAIYTLQVGREKKTYTGKGETITYTVTGADGKYSYTITGEDAGKNKTTVRGNFTLDTVTTLTRVSVKSPKVVADKVQTTLSWTGERNATFALTDGNTSLYSGTKASCALSLSAGTHSYMLTAMDSAGNTKTLEVTLNVDPTAKTKVTVSTQEVTTAASALDEELLLSAGCLALPGTATLDAGSMVCTPLALTTGTEAEKRLSSLATVA